MNEEQFFKKLQKATQFYNEKKYQKALKILKKIEDLAIFEGNWAEIYHEKFYILKASILLKLGRVFDAIQTFAPEFKKVPHSPDLIKRSDVLLRSPQVHNYINENVYTRTAERKIYKELINRLDDPLKKGRLLILWYHLAYVEGLDQDQRKMERYMLDQLRIDLPEDKDLQEIFKSRKIDRKRVTKVETNKNYEELFNKGTIALNNRKLQEALKYFKEASKLVKNDPELYGNIGITYLHLDDLERALSFLHRALNFDAYNPIVFLNIGLIHSMKGNYDTAISTINKLLEHHPNFSQALPFLMQIKRQKELFGSLLPEGKNVPEKALKSFKTGLQFMHRNKLPQAVESIKVALDEYPEFAEAYLFLGIIEQLSNNGELALKLFETALEHDPNLFLAWIHKGWVYDSLKQYEKALECYDKGINLNSDHSSSYNNKGLALDALERYEEAIECYTKSIELNPDFDGVWYNRATTYKKINQIERALADYKKTLELNPHHEDAKEQIDNLKHWSVMGVEGTYRVVVDARDYCPRCGKKNYTNNKVCPFCGTKMEVENLEELLQSAVNDETLGNFENALMTLIRINEKEPTLGEAWFYRGKAHCALAEFKNAVMCFNKSQQLGFRHVRILMYNLLAQGKILKFEPPNLDKNNLAEIDIKPVVYENNEEEWIIQGAASQMFMQYEQAYKCYQEALKLNKIYTPAIKNSEFIEKLAKR